MRVSVALMTDRLTIRNFVAGDWEDLREIALDKEASQYAAYDYAFPTAEEDVRRVLERFSRRDGFLAVCLTETNKVIGFINFDGEPGGLMELGYCFHSAYHGKGYATEACGALLQHAFLDLNVRDVACGTASVNEPSLRLLARLGFRKTGESIVSFRKAADGSPFEFLGSFFELDKDTWLKARKP